MLRRRLEQQELKKVRCGASSMCCSKFEFLRLVLLSEAGILVEGLPAWPAICQDTPVGRRSTRVILRNPGVLRYDHSLPCRGVAQIYLSIYI